MCLGAVPLNSDQPHTCKNCMYVQAHMRTDSIYYHGTSPVKFTGS